MSTGACRALVAWLLTLVATIALVLPAAAASDQLRETAGIRYNVDPSTGRIEVNILLTLATAGNRAFAPDEWGPLILEERAEGLRFSSEGFDIAGDFAVLPGLWKAGSISVPRIDVGERVRTRITYTLDASIENAAAVLSATPARVGDGYIYFCVVGQAVDGGQITVNLPGRFSTTQTGTRLQETDTGLELPSTTELGEVFACIEATDDRRLVSAEFLGPDDRRIILQAWPESPSWVGPAEISVEPVLNELREFLGHAIPGSGPVIIRQTPPRALGGYASAHATPGIVQLDEDAGAAVAPYHEMAHAWFGADEYPEQWMREGITEWTASSVVGESCAPVAAGDGSLNLREWQVTRPTAPEDIESVIADQEAAACGIMSAVAERMGEQAWRDVLGSLLLGEAKYVGRGSPPPASTRTVDYREWLDAVDERGLVPAGVEDLDFAQGLLESYGIPVDTEELRARSEARARYHQFLADAGTLGAPRVVRENLDNWFFADAMLAMDKAEAVRQTLTAADELLPVAGFIPVIQPLYEAADTVEALDQVLAQAEVLRESATEVIEPLTELLQAAPEGWDFPAALRDIITRPDLDVEEAIAAVEPSLEIVQELVAADTVLPQAGLLERYRARYENTASIERLEELADLVSAERAAAGATSAALDVLEAQAGDWAIPEAVTLPIERGQLAAAQEIVDDARAVVEAAREADIALPEADISADIRPQFEAVTSAPEMAALRRRAETVRDDAEAVGAALGSLRAVAPGWELPQVVSVPVAARDYATAGEAARVAQRWIEAAAKADQALEDFGAMERIRADFEGATTTEQLIAGSQLAESWSTAATQVGLAIEESRKPRDLLEQLGLFGVDVSPEIEEARQAAIEGNVAVALERAGHIIETLRNGSGSGALRLAGLIFFAVAVLGVLGMWFIFRRQAGPSWARQTTPHWIKRGEQRALRAKDEQPKPKQLERGRSNARGRRR